MDIHVAMKVKMDGAVAALDKKLEKYQDLEKDVKQKIEKSVENKELVKTMKRKFSELID